MTAAKTKAKEFELSEGVPEAVLASELARAEAAWQERSDAAAAAVKMPANPYRVRGDEKAGRWFVEGAVIVRTDKPGPSSDAGFGLMSLSLWRYSIMGGSKDPKIEAAIREEQAERTRQETARLDADKPKAKLEWQKLCRKRRGFFTYARALRWLREYLEPIRDESTYFRPDGSEA